MGRLYRFWTTPLPYDTLPLYRYLLLEAVSRSSAYASRNFVIPIPTHIRIEDRGVKISWHRLVFAVPRNLQPSLGRALCTHIIITLSKQCTVIESLPYKPWYPLCLTFLTRGFHKPKSPQGKLTHQEL